MEKTEKKNLEEKNNLRHPECGGVLEPFSDEKIEAGKPGNFYFLYRCSRCQQIIVVGGK